MLHRAARFPEVWNPRGPLPASCAYTINRAHWAAGYCLGAWLLGRGVPQNLVTGELAVATGTATAAVGPCGPAFRHDGSTGPVGWRVRNGTILSGLPNWTIVAILSMPSTVTTNASSRPIYVERMNGLDALKFAWSVQNNSGVGQIWRNSAGNLIIHSASSTMRDDTPRVVGNSFDWVPNTASSRLYLDGVQVGTTGTVTAANVTQSDAGKTAGIGYDTSTTSGDRLVSFWGDIPFVAVFGRTFSAAEHAAFAREPYRLLIPAG